jgi:hypothetical protein
MTNQLTLPEIERRLRLAAPDEPAVLPRLLLPVGGAGARGAAIRLRSRPRRAQDLRLLVALAALLLAFAVAVAAGGLRLLQQSNEPLAGACSAYGPIFLDPYGPECRPVDVPSGWVELGSGQLFPGTGTEVGLSNEIASLVMATVPLGSCASPGGPFPTGIPVGSNEIHVPEPTPDAGLACIQAAALPADAVRVVVLHGQRSLGAGPDGWPLPDLSEPTEEAGWTEVVDGRPARLTIETGTPGRPAETRTWDVLQPGSLENVVRIRATIAGPDLEAGRAAVQRIIDAVDFKATVPPIDEAGGPAVLRELLDALERSTRESGSDFYSCFPREPGTGEATVTGGPSAPLAAPLEVQCSTEMAASLAGVWRVTLETSWSATGGSPADTLRMQYFTTGERFGGSLLWSGGYAVSRGGRATPEVGVDGLLPNTGYALPPALEGPLDLPPGSLVRVLYPGEAVVPEPGEGDDSLYPGMVNRHLLVIDGPTVIDGDAWYRVQSESGFVPELGYIRGVRDGRPQLEIVAPRCPSGSVTVGDVAWLIAAERLACFGDAELTFESAVLAADDWQEAECMGEDGVVRPCGAEPGQPDWLTSLPRWKLYGEGGPAGPDLPLLVWFAPSVTAPSEGAAVRVRGHFDDAAALGCSLPDAAPRFEARIEEALCRQRFVITSIETR